jgi:hypothetical protein
MRASRANCRYVDEDVVDLVDDPERMPALHELLDRRSHVVPQVVEAELGVGAVGDVRGVRDALVLVRLHVLDHPHLHSEHVVDRAHPVRVPPGEVVVDRHEVDAVARERVEKDRKRRDQCLALAGLHLGDRAVVEHHPADQLDIEVPHVERPLGGFAAEREGIGQEHVDRLAVSRVLPELVGLLAYLRVGQKLHLRLDLVDALDPLRIAPKLAGLAQAKRAIYQSPRHRS